MTVKHSVFYVFLALFIWAGCLLPSSAESVSFVPIVKSEKEKVAHISISSIVQTSPRIRMDPFLEKFFPDIPKQQKRHALGSGFIISSDGYIVTNHHVVAKADKIEVTLYSGKKYKAKIVGKDKQTELALIKIKARGLPYIKWGDSSAVEVGEWVLAIGNPLGLDHTVTAGIISARGRQVFGGTAYGQFLQTDAAINFGNSGGPLFNLKGEVIGINTAIVAGGQNLGFAIPGNLAIKVIKQLQKYGEVKRGWFGVGIQDVSHELAEAFDLPKGMKGVAVTSVAEGSPAERGGLRQGDVIVEFNGEILEKTNNLQRLVAETEPGTRVSVKIFRDGRFLKKTIKVGRKTNDEARGLSPGSGKYGWELTSVASEIKAGAKVSVDYGLLVSRTYRDGIASELGITKGDIILKANGRKLISVNDLYRMIKKSKKHSKPVGILLMKSSGHKRFIALPSK